MRYLCKDTFFILFDSRQFREFDAVAFGCPSMGDEQLEESEFGPMFAACEPFLKGKKKSSYLDCTAGATANGCALGNRLVYLPAPFWAVTA